MTIISNGILGTFSGKVGSVIGSSWKGIDYIRSVPKKVKRIATANMLNQQAKFKLVVDFLNPLRKFLTESNQGKNLRKMTLMNLMTRKLLKEAVKGDLPSISLDYSKIELSQGEVNGLFDLRVDVKEKDVLFNWKAHPKDKTENPEDKVVLVVYNAMTQKFQFIQIGRRVDQSHTYKLNENVKGEKIVMWIFSMNNEKEIYSNSKFIGEFVA